MKKYLTILAIVCLIVGCKKTAVEELPKKLVCSVKIFGNQELVYKYLDNHLLFYEETYSIDVENEEVISEYLSMWEEEIMYLDGIKGATVSWSISDDRTQMTYKIAIDLNVINIDDIPTDDYYYSIQYWSIVDEKNQFDVSLEKSLYEEDGYSCKIEE